MSSEEVSEQGQEGFPNKGGRPKKWASDAERMRAARASKPAPGFYTPGHIACCPCPECLARRGFGDPALILTAVSARAFDLPTIELPADSPSYMFKGSLICRPELRTWKTKTNTAEVTMNNDKYRIKADVLDRAK